MPQVQTCGPHPCPDLDCDRSLIRNWRECVGQNQQTAIEGLSVGYTPEQLGIYDEKGGHGSLYNLLEAYGTYGMIDSACTYDWINGTKSCDKGDVKFAPQPITAQERAQYTYQQQFGEGIQGYMNRLQTEELGRQSSWRGANWTREGQWFVTNGADGQKVYADAYGMIINPATGQRTGEQYGAQPGSSFYGTGNGAPGTFDWSDNINNYMPWLSGGAGGPGGPGGLNLPYGPSSGFGNATDPSAGGGPGAALTFDQRMGQMLGLDQGAQAFNLQKAEQDEAERRTYDTYLSDLYGDILGVDFNRPAANPWIQNYLAADIPVPGSSSGSSTPAASPAACAPGAVRNAQGQCAWPNGVPPGGLDPNTPPTHDPGSPRGPLPNSTDSDSVSALGESGGTLSERAELSASAEDPDYEPGACPPGDPSCSQMTSCPPDKPYIMRGGGGQCTADPSQADFRNETPGSQQDMMNQIISMSLAQALQGEQAVPGGRTLAPPGPRQGTYTQQSTSFNPNDARTFGMLAMPLSAIQKDMDAERTALKQLLPQGGELDRALAQGTSDVFGRVAGLRGDLFNTAIGGIQGMAGRQSTGTGGTSGALGTAAGLQGQNSANNSNLMSGLMGMREDEKNRKSGLFGSLLNTLGTLGGAAIQASDKRAKKDIKESEHGLEAVLALPVYDFTYNKRVKELAGRRATGVMAQDVEKVMPEAVIKDEKGTKHVDYMALFGATMNAIKELDRRTAPKKSCESCPGKKVA